MNKEANDILNDFGKLLIKYNFDYPLKWIDINETLIPKDQNFIKFYKLFLTGLKALVPSPAFEVSAKSFSL